VLNSTTRAVLTIGAVLVTVAGVGLLLLALLLPARVTPTVTPVDGASFALPAPGLLGGTATVYGTTPGADARELGCRLLSKGGQEQSRAKLSSLRAAREEVVTLDGTTFHPLFTVSSWPTGARIECADAAPAGRLALGSPSTFGGLTGTVRLLALTAGVLCLVLGPAALVALRVIAGRARGRASTP
jgi:hypothetical protein